MKRRQWLVGAGAAASTGVGPTDRLDAQTKGAECYELRTYHVRIGEQKTALDTFLREAAVPAWNRQGIRPVGVFETSGGPEMPKVHVLLTYPDCPSLASSAERLDADAEFQKAAAAWLNRPATAPGYIRFESVLLYAFPNVPHIEVPDTATDADSAQRGNYVVFRDLTGDAFRLRVDDEPGSSSNRPALTAIQVVGRHLPIDRIETTEEIFAGIKAKIAGAGYSGRIVLTAGIPTKERGPTNTVHVVDL